MFVRYPRCATLASGGLEVGRGPEFSSVRAFFVLVGVASPGAGVTGSARVEGGVNPCWVHICAR
jgi:hypothetical protein